MVRKDNMETLRDKINNCEDGLIKEFMEVLCSVDKKFDTVKTKETSTQACSPFTRVVDIHPDPYALTAKMLSEAKSLGRQVAKELGDNKSIEYDGTYPLGFEIQKTETDITLKLHVRVVEESA